MLRRLLKGLWRVSSAALWLFAVALNVEPRTLAWVVAMTSFEWLQDDVVRTLLLVVTTIVAWHWILDRNVARKARARADPLPDMSLHRLITSYLRFDAKLPNDALRTPSGRSVLPREAFIITWPGIIEDAFALGDDHLSCWGRCLRDRTDTTHSARRKLKSDIWQRRILNVGYCCDPGSPGARTRETGDACGVYYDLHVNRAQALHLWPRAWFGVRWSRRIGAYFRRTDWWRPAWQRKRIQKSASWVWVSTRFSTLWQKASDLLRRRESA